MTILRATYRDRADVTSPSFSVDVDLADHGDDWAAALASARVAVPEGCVMLFVVRLEDGDPRLAQREQLSEP